MEFFNEFKGKKLLFLAHQNADVDAIASILLLKRLLGSGDLAVAGGVSLGARHLVPSDAELLINPDVSSYDLVVLVDSSTIDQLEGVDLSKANTLVTIDHHAPHASITAIAKKAFIMPECISCTEVIYRVFSPILDKEGARLLLLGIISDSARLRIAPNAVFLLVAKLLSEHKLDYSSLCDSLDVPLQLSERIACIKGAQRAELHRVGKYLVLTAKMSSFEASVARSLVSLGADVAFVASDSNQARVSARARITFIREYDLHLGKDIMNQVGALLGGSGSGHDAAAGANGPLLDKLDEALALCVSLIRAKVGK